MGIKIQNNAAKPIWLRLNSGNSISVFPNQPAPEVENNEIKGNPAVQKLIDRNAIAIVKKSVAKKGSSEANKKSVPKKNSAKANKKPAIKKSSAKATAGPKQTKDMKK